MDGSIPDPENVRRLDRMLEAGWLLRISNGGPSYPYEWIATLNPPGYGGSVSALGWSYAQVIDTLGDAFKRGPDG